MERLFGCHVSSAGGIENSLKAGINLGINTIQLHPSPPQRWNSKPYPPGFEDSFLALRPTSGVKKVFFHGVYLINLANPDPQQFHLSKNSLLHYLDLSQRINGDGVIFHVGNSKHSEDEAAAFVQAAEGINWILDKLPGKGKLILEVAAGAGAVIGDRVEELRAIYDRVDDKSRVGFGLDSQHMWASGYDLRNDLPAIVKNIEETFTIEKIWAIHLNDSKTPLASRKDRHANLGEGEIGMDALSAFINHKSFVHIPLILETPAMKDESLTAAEVTRLRGMLTQ